MSKTKTNKKEKITLTKEQILTMVKTGGRQKDITKEEFTRYVRPCGTSGHIGVSRAWVGKLVKVNMEEVKEDKEDD